MTKTRIELLWDELASSHRSGSAPPGAFKLKMVDPEFRFDLYAGMDDSGCLMLAAGMGRAPPMIRLDSTALDYFRQERADGRWLMVLRLREGTLAPVFGKLCQDLIDSAATVADEPSLIALIRERLLLWRKLFERGNSGLLEPFQIKGLIAELLVLESLIADEHRPPLEAVTAWVGPSGSDQDFLFSGDAIEVKAVGPDAEGVSISSLQQLDCSAPLQLRVQTMRSASASEANAVGLNMLTLRLEGILSTAPEALLLFRGKLLEAGYVENPFYDTVLFELTKAERFQVTPDFPKLTCKSVPPGVVSAAYVVALNCVRNLAEVHGDG